MLRERAHKIAVAIAFVLLTAWLLIGGWQSSQAPQPSIQYRGTAAEKDGAGRQPKEEMEKTDEAIARYTRWLANFTAILAFATVGLGVATVGLYLIGKGQIRLAREEFVSTHRPRLIVRQFRIDQVLPNHPIKIWISVVNVGDTTAHVRSVASDIGIWEGRYYDKPGIDPIVRPVTDEKAKMIRSGVRVSFLSQSKVPVTQAQVAAISSFKKHIRIVGEIFFTKFAEHHRRVLANNNQALQALDLAAGPVCLLVERGAAGVEVVRLNNRRGASWRRFAAASLCFRQSVPSRISMSQPPSPSISRPVVSSPSR